MNQTPKKQISTLKSPQFTWCQLKVLITNGPKTFGFRLKIGLPTIMDFAEQCKQCQFNFGLQCNGKLSFG